MSEKEITLGMKIVTPARTVTETDIVNFAGLSGDFHPAHTNELYASSNPLLGKRVAHGLLSLCISEGLFLRTNFVDWEKRSLISLGFEKVKFPHPVFAGDTIRSEFEAVEIRDSKSRKDMHIVVMKCECKKQTDEIICEYEHPMLISR